MATTQCPPRPSSTNDLVGRLAKVGAGLDNSQIIQESNSQSSRESWSEKEAAALRALSQSVIQVFAQYPNIPYALEAVLLSPFTSSEEYNSLFEAFTNIIAEGTSDDKIPNSQLLTAFNTLLHSHQAELVGGALPLGNAMLSIQKQLHRAIEAAHPPTQYTLICGLSAVLDAMNEAKVEGIIDVKVQDLLGQLDKLSDHKELRLAQAARYAYQALLGIPTDVSPWKKIRDNAYTTLKGGAKVAGSVYTLDPSKLLDGVEDLSELPELIESIIDVIKSLAGLTKSVSRAQKELKTLKKPKGWYVALRATDGLVRANASQHLNALLQNPSLPCRDDKEFLCGLCTQLELARDMKHDKVVEVMRAFLVQQGKTSTHDRVREWVRLTTGQANLTKATKYGLLGWMSKPNPEKYGTSLDYLKLQSGETRGILLNEAWKTCLKAKIFYADQVIRHRYTSKELLKIERLNGDSLPMNKCYINLAIVQDNVGEEAKDKDKNSPSPFSLLRRLKIWEPPESNRIALQTLFEKREGGLDANSYEDDSGMLLLVRPSYKTPRLLWYIQQLPTLSSISFTLS
jgi:hypothetical protein